MLSPGYDYSAVQVKEIFLTRDAIKAKLRQAEAMFRKYSSTRAYDLTWSSSRCC